MSVTAIGSVVISFHGAPSFSRSSSPTSRAGQEATISGRLDWAQIDQLAELLNNPALQRTVGGATGILEYLDTNDAKLASRKGWYLFSNFKDDPEQQHSLANSPVPFSLTGVYLGDSP